MNPSNGRAQPSSDRCRLSVGLVEPVESLIAVNSVSVAQTGLQVAFGSY